MTNKRLSKNDKLTQLHQKRQALLHMLVTESTKQQNKIHQDPSMRKRECNF